MSANSVTASHLRLIYRYWHGRLPWPAPIPGPAEVTFRWSRQGSHVLGSCQRSRKRIDISPLFRDWRLLRYLKQLMAHEMAHFIWSGHPAEFQEFLRHAGISEEFAQSSGSAPEFSRALVALRAAKAVAAPARDGDPAAPAIQIERPS